MNFEPFAIECAETIATIIPARGGLISQLSVRGKDILYLDRATLEDESKNVRGGIPVLFPFAGKLDNGRFLPANTEMKQHGFGRNTGWQVAEKRAHTLRLSLAPDAQTRAQYPFEFLAEQTVMAIPDGLHIELLITNAGADALPVSPGWHPYFCCPRALKGYVTGDVAGLTPDKVGNDIEFDFGLPAPKNGRATFAIPEMGQLSVSFSPQMRHLQFWSQPGKDFICIEPFFGPNNTVNTNRRMDIAPGDCRMFWMRIEIRG